MSNMLVNNVHPKPKSEKITFKHNHNHCIKFTKMIKKIYLVSAIIGVLLLMLSCNKNEPFSKATVETSLITSITEASALCGGLITEDGGTIITTRGVCWSTSPNPTIANDTTINNAGTGPFESLLKGLSPSTTYFVRAYAVNKGGVAYGLQMTFTTKTFSITTNPIAISFVTATTAAAGGEILSDGDSSILTVKSRGVCWNTFPSPTIENRKTIDGIGGGRFTSSIDSLLAFTTYYVRAYATNGNGTIYGNEVSFTTLSGLVSLETTEPITLSAYTATSGGTITSDGGAAVTERGVCWSYYTLPTIENNKTSNGSGNGSFASSLTELIPGTTYFVRSYATNCVGTSYGNEVSFTAQSGIVYLVTTSASAISAYTAMSGGSIQSNGGAPVTSRGICWSTSPTPTIANLKTSDGSGNGNFSSSITDLTPGTIYFVRSYATNSVGTSYGNEVFFSTQNGVVGLSTSSISSVMAYTATSGGTISSDGGAPVTERGVCWSTNSTPTIEDFKTSNGSGNGTFSSNITGLAPSTTYYVRSYATNSVGTSYGSEVSFKTQSGIIGLATSSISSILAYSATSGGTISSDGGAPVTVRGVCWSTTTSPTIANSKTSNSSGIGTFSSSITGLTPSTTYYVRSYATNSVGTSYGNEVSFSTQSGVIGLATSSTSSILAYSATSGGTITSDGGAPVTVRGVCWSTTTSPTIANSKTSNGSGIGTFSSSITGLTPGTTYYVRSYGINSVGTTYGNEVSFITQSGVIGLTTSVASSIGANLAKSGGTISFDGGAAVTDYGVCWSTSSTPTIANSKTSNGSGIVSYTSLLTGLLPLTTYYVRAFATNSVGTSYGNELNFKTLSNSVTDIDGNKYSTITIGLQEWLVENLKTTKYNDGTSIPNVIDVTTWSNLITPGYCFYNNDAANKATYGALYNWYTVNTGKLAPTGWHVPTDAEWTTLENYLIANGYNYDGTTTDNKIAKSLAATSGWYTSTNTGAIGNDLTKNNTSGFVGLPGGYRYDYATFYEVGSFGLWWSSTQVKENTAWSRGLYYSGGTVNRYSFFNKRFGFSVRCVRDN